MPACDSNLELFAVLFFFGAVSVLGVNAQLPPNGVEFKAPFAFLIGTSNLPAGDYTIRPSQEDPDVVTEGKSLTFYTFDLNEDRAIDAKHRFEVWGSQQAKASAAQVLHFVSLGNRKPILSLVPVVAKSYRV
jgi:hypothetical protein